jgi:hypothetical protein
MASATTIPTDEENGPGGGHDPDAHAWDGWFAKFEGVGLARMDDEADTPQRAVHRLRNR